MNKSQLIDLYDQELRKEIEYPDMRREVTPDVVRYIDTSDIGEGMVTYSRLTEASVDRVVQEQVQFFGSIGQDFEWKVYDYDKPHDLKDRLEAYGFIIEEVEAIEILDLASAPEILWQPVRHTIRRINDPEKLLDVQKIQQQVWEEDASWVLHLLGDALRLYPERMSVYVAYVDEKPASSAWIYFPKNSLFASLWGGATIPAFRNRGLFTALLAVRAQEARARQVSFLTVDAMPMSRPILEKFGFQMIASSYPCKWKHKSNITTSPNVST